jgi:hypothetical protein
MESLATGARFTHTNLIAYDWRNELAEFYCRVFGCRQEHLLARHISDTDRRGFYVFKVGGNEYGSLPRSISTRKSCSSDTF